MEINIEELIKMPELQESQPIHIPDEALDEDCGTVVDPKKLLLANQ
jgi:hypothetical protein